MKRPADDLIHHSGDNTTNPQSKAIELISAYTAQLRAGRAPHVQTVIDSYNGPKTQFAEELHFAIFLEHVFRRAREEAAKWLKPDDLEKARCIMQDMVKETEKNKGADLPK